MLKDLMAIEDIEDKEIMEQMLGIAMENKLGKRMKEIKSIIISNIKVETSETEKRLIGNKIERKIDSKFIVVEAKKNAELVKKVSEMEYTIEKYEKADTKNKIIIQGLNIENSNKKK